MAQAISAVVARARVRFPGISADAAVLADVVMRRAEVEPGQLSEEIVLVAACVLGDAGAVDEFERHYTPQLLPLAQGIVGDRAGDVMQDVRAKLLTGDRPRIADYGGRGSLLSWLRVVVAREAITAFRKQRREVAFDDDLLLGSIVVSHDPALALIRSESVAAIKRAFGAAVAALEVRDRNLLRQHLVDGLTIDDLAPLYRVHRVTISRWLAAARDRVWSATQKSLRSELALTTTQLDSLLTSAREYLDLSLERVLTD